jgi:hypothetical protein
VLHLPSAKLSFGDWRVDKLLRNHGLKFEQDERDYIKAALERNQRVGRCKDAIEGDWKSKEQARPWFNPEQAAPRDSC